MSEPGPEVVDVLHWKRHERPIGDGTGRPAQVVVGGPEVMMIRCTKCNKRPWRVTESRKGADDSHFEAQGTMVSIYCATCEQLRGQSVSSLPRFVETHS